MKKTVIPAGYRISVTSWENDGDNYKTKIKEGVVNPLHVVFIVAVCNLMGSNCNGNGFGNLLYDDSTVGLAEAISEIIEQHPGLPDNWLSGEAVEEGLLYELGLKGGSEYFATRVFESVKIEYVPSEIVLEDVTSQFV